MRHTLDDIDEVQRFLEKRQLVGRLSVRIERERGAVEYEFILAADEVCVNNGEPGLGGAVARHGQARGMLARVIGRCVQHQQHLRSRGTRHTRCVGAPRLAALPRSAAFRAGTGFDRALLAPKVLADIESQAHAAHVEHHRLAAGLEITLLVEYGVIGQVALAIVAAILPSCNTEAALWPPGGCGWLTMTMMPGSDMRVGPQRNRGKPSRSSRSSGG